MKKIYFQEINVLKEEISGPFSVLYFLPIEIVQRPMRMRMLHLSSGPS